MKKLYFIFIILLLSEVSISQTFEKTIIAPTYDVVRDLIIDNNDDILLVTSSVSLNSLDIDYFPFSQQYSKLISLHKDGRVKQFKNFYGQDFGVTLDTSYTYLYTMAGVLRNNKYLMGGLLKMDTSYVFNKLFYELDTGLSIIRHKIIDTTYSEFFFFSRLKNAGNMQLLSGVNFSFNNGFFKGGVGFVDSTLNDTIHQVYATSDSIYIKTVHDVLIDKKKQLYLFGDGFIGNGQGVVQSISPMQLVKVDSAYDLIKLEYIQHPPISSFDFLLQDALTISSFWVSDSSFLLAVTGPTELNRKGDVHLFVYDTNLVQQNYRRIVTPDTSEYNAGSRIAAYDSVCNCFYMGTTKRYKDYNYSQLGLGDTTDFQLIKFDKDLNIIFNRSYRRSKTMTFVQLKTDSKGNVIMAGHVQDINPQDVLDTDIFILKVDSNGNLLSTGIKDNKQIDPLDYSIFPNPVEEEFTFKQYNIQESYVLSIFDIKGQSLKEFSITDTEHTFSMAGLAKGAYVYQLVNSKGAVKAGKLIKK